MKKFIEALLEGFLCGLVALVAGSWFLYKGLERGGTLMVQFLLRKKIFQEILEFVIIGGLVIVAGIFACSENKTNMADEEDFSCCE